MKYKEKTVILRNGQDCVLRSATPEDAEILLNHLRQICGETRNLMRYEDEVNMTAEEEADFLQGVESAPASCMISAYIGGELAGNANIAPASEFEKYRHRAVFGLSVKKKFWHLGVGAALLSACIESACEAGYEQIELEVVADNVRAIALYARFGFVTYGERPQAAKYRDGSYSAIILMVLPLNPQSLDQSASLST